MKYNFNILIIFYRNKSRTNNDDEKSTTFSRNNRVNNLRKRSGIDLLVIFSLIIKNWYWFVIAIVVAFFCARFYIGHTMPVYRTSATILINETEERPLVDNSELLQGLGLPGGMKNLENQIMILKSRALTESTSERITF